MPRGRLLLFLPLRTKQIGPAQHSHILFILCSSAQQAVDLAKYTYIIAKLFSEQLQLIVYRGDRCWKKSREAHYGNLRAVHLIYEGVVDAFFVLHSVHAGDGFVEDVSANSLQLVQVLNNADGVWKQCGVGHVHLVPTNMRRSNREIWLVCKEHPR